MNMLQVGPWTVEVVDLDGRQWYQVKKNGVLTGGEGRRHGLVATADEAQELLGTAFADLGKEPTALATKNSAH